MDEITADPEPVSLAAIEQRLFNLDVSVRNLFGALKRKRPCRPFLSDGKIAELLGREDVKKLSEEHWTKHRARVTERVDSEGFEWC